MATTVPPAHVVAPLAGLALTRFAGYVSVKAAPVIATAFELVSVMVRVEVPFTPIGFAPNAFETAGCAITKSVAEAPDAMPALVVVTLPVELRYEPAAAEVTFTVIVHAPLAGTVAPESARLLPPLAAVTVPPAQVVAPLAEPVFTRPAG